MTHLYRATTALLLLLCTIATFAQGALKGKVFDAYNQSPLSGADVVFSNGTATTTDENGNFMLACSNDSLTISFIGYEPFQLLIKNCDRELSVGLIPSFYNLNTVTVSATPSGSAPILREPQSISPLTRREMLRGNNLFLENALNLVTGVRMEKRTMSGGQRITIRGYGNGTNFNGTGYKAYLNDIPLTDAEGTTILDDVDFSLLGKLDAIKGPASSLYGTGIGGVIKMYTLRPEPGVTKLTQELIGGSYGLLRSNTRLENATGNSSILLNYGHQDYDSYRVNSASKKDYMTFTGDFRPNDRQVFTAYLAYNNSKEGLAGQLDSIEFNTKQNVAEPPYLSNKGHVNIESFRTSLGHEYRFTNWLSNRTSAFYSGYTLDQAFAVGQSSNNVQNFGARTEFRLSIPAGSVHLNGVVGGEFQRTVAFKKSYGLTNAILGALRGDLETATQQGSAFTEWDLQLPADFMLTAGASLNYITYDITDRLTNSGNPTHPDQSGTKRFDAVVTPRVALSKVFNDKVSAYVAYSSGYSPPTSGSVVIAAIGEVNKNIKPEKGNQIEVGTKGNLLQGKLSYQLAWFNLTVDDKLVSQAVTDDKGSVLYTITTNVGKQQNQGVELALSYAIFNDPNKPLSLLRPFVNYTYSDFTYKNFKSDNNNDAKTIDYSGNDIVGVPPSVLSAGLDIGLKWGFYLYTTYQYVDKMPITNDNKHYADAYGLLSSKLGYKANIGKHFEINLYGGGENLTNELFYNMVFLNANFNGAPPKIYLPGPYKATFYGGGSLSFKF